MLPFSSIDFYVIAIMIVAWIFVSKYLLSKIISLPNSILLASLFYLFFYYPKPYHILAFIFYSYIIYYFFTYKLKHKNKLAGTLLILIPMIIMKSDIHLQVYAFDLSNWISFAGLSYVSFRIVSIYLESGTEDKPIGILKYLNFLIFTPTLLIGPIDRYKRFLKDLQEGYSGINLTNLLGGFEKVLLGVFYKYVCAELVDRYWLNAFDHNSTELLHMMNTMYAYYFYLFFDFAGYSAMAIGFGKMIGINVPENFIKPFLARNPQDFWRRFHVTLGEWLKDYFFMPFYKYFSQKKSLKPYPLLRQNVALFMTFLLMGCWNGFRANYIISGALFGIYSAVHNTYIYYSRKKGRDIIFGSMNKTLVKWISIFVMFNAAAFAIYIFSDLNP